MVTVSEAEKIVLAEAKDFGTETIAFADAIGRVLAEDIHADRPLPPYDRVTMDGIAISYNSFAKGNRAFTIKGTQAAGDKPLSIDQGTECIEIMTGATLPKNADTIIRYEDLAIENGTATININNIRQGQNVHKKGSDKASGDVVAPSLQIIQPAFINVAASVGKTSLIVKKLPRVVIISTGDELVKPEETPEPYQIRQSNNHAIKAVLQQLGLQADLLHIPEDAAQTEQALKKCIDNYDAIILSGGISMGKFDYVPQSLENLGVQKLFYKVQQRPGKPFWFGKNSNGVLAFAFPGNPVSTFMCLYRYFIPWLRASLELQPYTKKYAILDADISFEPPLQYFMQVKMSINEQAQLIATPVTGNGSGDFANLMDADAFMELPLESNNFNKGKIYPVWPFNAIL